MSVGVRNPHRFFRIMCYVFTKIFRRTYIFFRTLQQRRTVTMGCEVTPNSSWVTLNCCVSYSTPFFDCSPCLQLCRPDVFCSQINLILSDVLLNDSIRFVTHMIPDYAEMTNRLSLERRILHKRYCRKLQDQTSH